MNTYTTSDQNHAAVALDASGNFVIVWDSFNQDGSGAGVYGQRYASTGIPLGPEFSVNTYTTDFQGNAVVSSDASGKFVVIWESLTQEGIFGQRYASTGVPLGTEFRINTDTTSSQLSPSVGSSPASGTFVVAWHSDPQDGSYSGVFGQRYSISGAPLGPEFRINTYTPDFQGRAVVALDALGNFVVVWESLYQDGSNSGVFGQRFAASGVALGPEFRVNTYTTLPQSFPAVAADASGNFVVVWESFQDGSSSGVFGQRYASTGAPIGPEFRVNTYTTDSQRLPAVASDPTGNFVIIWESVTQDGFGSGVFGQRYAGSGAPLGTEFQINTYTTSFQGLPAVVSDAFGDFVVAWTSYTQDGSSDGVFGQRYRAIVPVEQTHFEVE